MHVHFHNSDALPDGTDPFVEPRGIYVRTLDPSYFQLDPIAVEAYRSMVESLRNNGASIVYVYMPIYRPLYDLNKTSYTTYLETMRRNLPPAPLVDFNGPEYTSQTSDRSNFFDCFHMRPRGAEAFVPLLTKLVQEAIASGH